MKNSLILYYEYGEHFSLLSDEELGQLIRAVLLYDKEGTVPELSGMVQMAFSFIKTNLDIDRAKYEERCERNRKNGVNGGRKPKEEKPTGFSGFSEKPKKPDTDTVTENETETVTVTETETDTDSEDLIRRHDPEQALIKLYEENVGKASGMVRRELRKWLSLVDESLLAYAIGQAAFHDKKSWAYVGGIVDCHYRAGRRDGASAEKASKGRKESRGSPGRYDFTDFAKQAIRS